MNKVFSDVRWPGLSVSRAYEGGRGPFSGECNPGPWVTGGECPHGICRRPHPPERTCLHHPSWPRICPRHQSKLCPHSLPHHHQCHLCPLVMPRNRQLCLLRELIVTRVSSGHIPHIIITSLANLWYFHRIGIMTQKRSVISKFGHCGA